MKMTENDKEKRNREKEKIRKYEKSEKIERARVWINEQRIKWEGKREN